MLTSLIILKLCSGQSSKCKNEQRIITPKLGMAELRFLNTAQLPIEIYLPTKFMFISLIVKELDKIFLKGEIIQKRSKIVMDL
jgi:hypothetical protein